MIGVELEDKINDAIERVVTEKNKDEVKMHFEDVTVNSMIDSVFEDW